jgi:hypothetical protein
MLLPSLKTLPPATMSVVTHLARINILDISALTLDESPSRRPELLLRKPLEINSGHPWT